MKNKQIKPFDLRKLGGDFFIGRMPMRSLIAKTLNPFIGGVHL